MSHKEENQLHKVDTILACFSQLEDPRSPINRVHSLGDLVVICIMAVIAGADGPQAIEIWAQANQEWLKERLKLPGGIPSHDTLGRLLTADGSQTRRLSRVLSGVGEVTCFARRRHLFESNCDRWKGTQTKP